MRSFGVCSVVPLRSKGILETQIALPDYKQTYDDQKRYERYKGADFGVRSKSRCIVHPILFVEKDLGVDVGCFIQIH